MNFQSMFAVDPVRDCPHCVDFDNEPFINKKFNEKCTDCENIGENWICLTCAKIFCSRYVNGHMVKVWHHPINLFLILKQ